MRLAGIKWVLIDSWTVMFAEHCKGKASIVLEGEITGAWWGTWEQSGRDGKLFMQTGRPNILSKWPNIFKNILKMVHFEGLDENCLPTLMFEYSPPS